MAYQFAILAVLVSTAPLAAASRQADVLRHAAPLTLAATPTSPGSSASTPSGGVGIAGRFSATMTYYGSGDPNGSGNCNANGACGFFDNPGYNAAVSTNLFGNGYKGPGCGRCYQLTPESDAQNRPVPSAKPIVVKVNNLCPPQGNPICNQTKTGDTNKLGAEGHFDLCINDGAAMAFFGTMTTGLAKGWAQEVDCSQWHGSQDMTTH